MATADRGAVCSGSMKRIHMFLVLVCVAWVLAGVALLESFGPDVLRRHGFNDEPIENFLRVIALAIKDGHWWVLAFLCVPGPLTFIMWMLRRRDCTIPQPW